MSSPADTGHPLPPQAYHRMALVLRLGLLLAGGFLAVALIAFLHEHPDESLATVLQANPILSYLDPSGLAHGLETGRAQAFLTVGILLLVVTPFARVATGLYYFVREGDRALVRISATVLLLLVVGVLVVGPLLR